MSWQESIDALRLHYFAALRENEPPVSRKGAQGAKTQSFLLYQKKQPW